MIDYLVNTPYLELLDDALTGLGMLAGGYLLLCIVGEMLGIFRGEE